MSKKKYFVSITEFFGQINIKLKTKLWTKPLLVVNSQSLTHGLVDYWNT